MTFRIVEGIKSDAVRDRLLRQGADLSFAQAVDICRAEEITREQMKSLTEHTSDVGSVRKNAVSKRKQDKGNIYKKYDQYHRTHSCIYCGRQHPPKKCPAYGTVCRNCNKKNHWSKCCKLRKEVKEISIEDDDTYVIETVANYDKKQCNTEATVVLRIKDAKVRMKIDTGAEVDVMPLRVFNQVNDRNKESILTLKSTSTKLIGYGGNEIPVCGVCSAKCSFQGKILHTDFYVVETDSRSVLGLDSCKKLDLIQVMCAVHKKPAKIAGTESSELQEHKAIKVETANKIKQVSNKFDEDMKCEIKQMYPEVFNGLGNLEPAYHMQIEENAMPVIHAPRKIPAALRDKLKFELEKMEANKVIAQVEEPTEWVNSLVVIEKPNGALRICLDPRDLNKVLKREHFQLPTWEEISTRIVNAKYFTKLDANHGYWQIPLDLESSLKTTFNTPFGRFRFLRMPFGIHSAQEVFHKRIYQHFENIEGCETDIDDFLIWGISEEEHDRRLIQTLEKAKQINLTLNIDKCKFKRNEITYLGHKLTENGIVPDPSKVEAISKMPPPLDKQGVQRVLGMVNYVAKFIPNVSAATAPLRALLQKDIEWQWGTEQQESFERIKQLLVNSQCLAYFDVEKPVTIQVDACKDGLGAVLMQEGKPVSYASRAMTEAQKRYAMIEKELLAVVFGCERYHQFIYGRKVSVQSDHKPLESIIKKPLANTPPRLQRMLLRLQKYDIDLTYKPGKEMLLADTLSRAHLSDIAEEINEEEMTAQIHMVTSSKSIPDKQLVLIKEETKKDEELQRLITYIEMGWPNKKMKVHMSVKQFWPIKEELSVIGDIVFKGERIIIPRSVRKTILANLHQAHLGIEKTKLRARETVFWPGINNDIEQVVQSCNICLESRNMHAKEPMLTSVIPEYPFEIVGTDLFFWNGQEYIIVVDYYSRFWEIERLRKTDSSVIIQKLKAIFSRYGIPKVVRSDNGPQYSSKLFEHFAKNWGFIHETSSPKYPQGNSLAERSIQTAKNILEKAMKDGRDPHLAILEYRNTPIDKYATPAQLLMSRNLRSILPVANNSLTPTIVDNSKFQQVRKEKQFQQKKYYDTNTRELPGLEKGTVVKVRDGKDWRPAVVLGKAKQPRSYFIRLESGQVWRRNRRHIIIVKGEDPANIFESRNQSVPPDSSCDINESSSQNLTSEHLNTPLSAPLTNETRTRSGRLSKPPDRFSY